MSRTDKSTKAENRLVVTRAWEDEEIESDCYGINLGKGEKSILKLIVVKVTHSEYNKSC